MVGLSSLVKPISRAVFSVRSTVERLGLRLENRTATLIIVTLLGAIAALRIVDTYSEFNATFDEAFHLGAALQGYQQGRFAIGVEQPPLARWAIGLFPQWAGAEFRRDGHRATNPTERIKEFAWRILERHGEYWKTLTLARLGNLFFLPILVLYTYRWAAALHGRLAGCIAVAIATFSPTVLAHAAVATVDLALAACLVVAGYYWWRWLQDRTVGRALTAGFASGLALAAKYSALGFLPAVFAGLVACRFGGRIAQLSSWDLPETRKAIPLLALSLALAVLTLWAAFGFEMRPLRLARQRPHELLERMLPRDTPLKRGIQWAMESVPLPLRDVPIGLSVVGNYVAGGRSGFLLGKTSPQGWWYYFPVALASKTTLPLLALVLLAGVCAWRRGGLDGDTLGPLVGVVGILIVVMPSALNLGVRHVLPVYPLLAIWASSCFRDDVTSRFRSLTVIALLLVGWHGVESWLAHPDYLPYFNQSVRGREHEILGDSNLDWGQDLFRLARYVETNEIKDLSLNYFGTTSPEAVGLNDYREFGPGDRPRGWVAISLTHRQGVYQTRPSWLDDYEPRARIGKSIWLYFIE